MRILGLHDGHLATACLVEDGRIAAMMSEERLTRRKNAGGPPVHAIGAILRQAGIQGRDVDMVALATVSQPLTTWGDDEGQWRRSIFQRASRLLPASLVSSHALIPPYLWFYGRHRDWTSLDAALRANGVATDTYRSHRYEHHLCHAATAYYLAPARRMGTEAAATAQPSPDPMLLVTLDGSGDGLSGSVSLARDGAIERLHAIHSFHSLGELYTRVTAFLGMAPLEHEYKVMGLAPYAPSALADRATAVFRRYASFDEARATIVNTSGAWGPAQRRLLDRDLRGVRFDGVAAGVQRLLEEIVPAFVRAWVAKTGVRRVGFAGGLFMNVKLNMILSEDPAIDEPFFMPSAGDESIAAGAALLAYEQSRREAGAASLPPIQPLRDLYLGDACPDGEIRAAVDAARGRIAWRHVDDMETEIAARLADGQIVGRVAGRMEWGARSLGNRAILSDPRNPDAVRRLNAAVKMRDFWMPFAASILEERAADYLVNPRGLDAPFMINAFRSTPLARRDLICGLHAADMTCRPQIVKACINPSYHRLLKAFEALTGVGGVVNTSFNLHGEPMVRSAADVVHTVLHSGIDAAAIENVLVWRT